MSIPSTAVALKSPGTRPIRASAQCPPLLTWRSWRCRRNGCSKAVSEAAEVGVGCCVIISTGFAEAGTLGARAAGEAGRSRGAHRHAHRRAELHGLHRPAPPHGAVLLGRVEYRYAGRRRDRPHQPERRAHGLGIRPRQDRRHRAALRFVARQPERSRNLRFPRIHDRGPRRRRRSASTSRGCSTVRAFARPPLHAAARASRCCW